LMSVLLGIIHLRRIGEGTGKRKMSKDQNKLELRSTH
jgi:hypothetical protein